MKNLILAGIIIGLFLSGCSKKKGDNSPQESYTLFSPECLFVNTKWEGEDSPTVYGYDEQRRLISMNVGNGILKRIYVYTGSTMTITQTQRMGNGDTIVTEEKNRMNPMGFIEAELRLDNSQMHYSYNKQGYLIWSQLLSATGKYSYAVSYQYKNGNRVSEYSLRLNPVTGDTEDTTGMISYVYYESLPGKIEAFNAWAYRLGRASKNEVKSKKTAGQIVEFKYVIGNNGMPVSTNSMYSWGEIKQNLEWKCN